MFVLAEGSSGSPPLPWLGVVTAFLTIVIAAYTFVTNTRVRRLEWLTKLFEKFYEGERYKELRDLIDCDDKPSEVLQAMVHDGDARLFDYLNFFEYVAYLWNARFLSFKEVEAMFGYPMRNLSCLPLTRKIIFDGKMGFEYTQKLLERIEQGR